MTDCWNWIKSKSFKLMLVIKNINVNIKYYLRLSINNFR